MLKLKSEIQSLVKKYRDNGVGDDAIMIPLITIIVETLEAKSQGGDLSENEQYALDYAKSLAREIILEPEHGTSEQEQYYIQDSSYYAGDHMLWWKPNGAGYTTDISQAGLFSKERVISQNQTRHTDIPWSKTYIDQAPHVTAINAEHVNKTEALKGTGIKLAKPPKIRKETYRCADCGRFLSEEQHWGGECPHCGADNRP